VLHLDADERLTSALATEIDATEAAPGTVAYNMASLTFMNGRPIPRASGFPVYQTRLTRAGAFEFLSVGHGQKAPDSLRGIPRLRNPYEHHPFEKGLEEWTRRHERYAAAEAEALLSSTATRLSWDTIRDPIHRRLWANRRLHGAAFRPYLIWLYLLVLRRGMLDGAEGREYCRRRRIYEEMVVREVKWRRGRRQPPAT
jgi:hypothetical protein